MRPRQHPLGTHPGCRSSSLAPMAVVALLTSITAGAGETLSGADFAYLGAFRLECSADWCAYNLDGVGLAADGSLWVTDHVYDFAVRRIGVPGSFSTSTVFDDLPEAATIEGPLATAGCPGTAVELNGVAAVGAEAATTCRDYYNVGPVYQSVYRRRTTAAIEEIGPRADPFHPNKYGAYLFGLPADWAAANGLGDTTLVTGFSREAGAFGGSQGPTLFAFDPDNPLDAVDLVWYRDLHPGCPGSCDLPGYESPDSWMGADWVRTASVDAIVVAGVKAGSTCYGSGFDCGDPCRPSQGYHGYPYAPMILFYDPDDLAARLAGAVEPWQVLPTSSWVPAELWRQDCPNVGGVAFDEATGRLFVAERLAGPFGEGIVHVFAVVDPELLFADGFETGTTGAWALVLPESETQNRGLTAPVGAFGRVRLSGRRL